MSKSKQTKPHAISNVIYLIEKDRLNFDPEYQRGYVWKKSQKELFIDSLFLDYDIPKIYFYENPKNKYKYDVVDGQQRLKSISEFVSGGIKLPTESDPINKEKIANKTFDDLSDDLQMEFRNISLDIVILNNEYTQDDIEDMFLRYQNGEPLNAAEKRKAIPGNFRAVVKELSKNTIFRKCAFSNHRDAYQDAAAKLLHIRINGNITSITPAAIKSTYIKNKGITGSNRSVKDIKKTFGFLNSAFNKCANKNPQFKKYAILTITEVANHLLELYSITDFKKEFADAYNNFEVLRIDNNEQDESLQDATLSSYTDAARGDSPAFQVFRFETLLNHILSSIEDLPTKDPKRNFTAEQRLAIYNRDEGVCQSCMRKVDFSEYHADHVLSYARGGVTKLSNGQLLCAKCNLKKGKKASVKKKVTKKKVTKKKTAKKKTTKRKKAIR